MSVESGQHIFAETNRTILILEIKEKQKNKNDVSIGVNPSDPMSCGYG